MKSVIFYFQREEDVQ